MSGPGQPPRTTPMAAPRRGRRGNAPHEGASPPTGSTPPNLGSSPGAQSPGTGSGASPKPRGTQLVPCKFFRQGTCTAGRNCQFLHDREQQAVAVCKFHLKGQCKFGNKCALMHTSSADAQRQGAMSQPTHPPPLSGRPPPIVAGPPARPTVPLGAFAPPRAVGFSAPPASSAPPATMSIPGGAPPIQASSFSNMFGQMRLSPSHMPGDSPPTLSPLSGYAPRPSQQPQQSSSAPRGTWPGRGGLFGEATSEPLLIGSPSSHEQRLHQQRLQQDDWPQQPRSWAGAAGSPLLMGSLDERFSAFSTTASGTPLAEALSRSHEERALFMGQRNTPPGAIGTHKYFGGRDYRHPDDVDSEEPSPESNASDALLDDRQYDPAFFLDTDQVLQDGLADEPWGSGGAVMSFADVAKARLPDETSFMGPYSLHPRAGDALCQFELNGKCRYGEYCRDAHGLPCSICHRNVLHPYNAEQSQRHMEECASRQALKAAGADSGEAVDSSQVECGICMERIMSKPDPRFGLLNCDHAFCLTCLREWRGTLNMDSAATHSCPLCRTVTYFVTPSSEWVTSGPYKAAVIQGYRDRLGKMPCKYFSEGRGTCPFGTSCFYAHILPDGSREQVQLRTLVDDDENVRVMQTVRLSDFLFAADRRRL